LLRHDAFESELAGVAKYGLAVVFHMLVESNARTNLGQDHLKGSFAALQRVGSEIVAVKFDQVESVQENAFVMVAVANAIEQSDPVVITGNRLAVDDVGARARAGQCLEDQGKTTREIIAGKAVEPQVCALLRAIKRPVGCPEPAAFSDRSTVRRTQRSRLSDRSLAISDDQREQFLELEKKWTSDAESLDQGIELRRAKASEMAGEQIDRLGDPSATDDERQLRKQRLIKGPQVPRYSQQSCEDGTEMTPEGVISRFLDHFLKAQSQFQDKPVNISERPLRMRSLIFFATPTRTCIPAQP
jgi:hypothetical protein